MSALTGFLSLERTSVELAASWVGAGAGSGTGTAGGSFSLLILKIFGLCLVNICWSSL